MALGAGRLLLLIVLCMVDAELFDWRRIFGEFRLEYYILDKYTTNFGAVVRFTMMIIIAENMALATTTAVQEFYADRTAFRGSADAIQVLVLWKAVFWTSLVESGANVLRIFRIDAGHDPLRHVVLARVSGRGRGMRVTVVSVPKPTCRLFHPKRSTKCQPFIEFLRTSMPLRYAK